MHSPKKGLICNLNHVHLQHVSLGLHLSRHPELQEDINTLGPPKDRFSCRECQEHDGSTGPELMDANSNNPSLPCGCCETHLLSSELRQGLPIQPSLANCPAVNHEEEEEEEEGSPSDPTSSSISSCSDLSFEESPVSVYCKAFPSTRAQSPEGQPNIVPLEEAQNILSFTGRPERVPDLKAQTGKPPEFSDWDSPDSLGNSSLTESPTDPTPTFSRSLVGLLQSGSNQAPPIVPPTLRPCRAPPARPDVPPLRPELDANCNAIPAHKTNTVCPSLDINSNQAPLPEIHFGNKPPPVPPRTKRGLQGLRREAGQQASETVLPALAKKPFHPSGPAGEASKKNITSFHELAQKRKKGPVAALVSPTKKDQSDWLIVFSPDTELPPCHELSWGERQEAPGPLPSSGEPPNPSSGPQQGVIPFQELRDHQKFSQLATNGPRRVIAGHAVKERSEPVGHLRGPKEMLPRRKTPRPGLQPIMEGGSDTGEDGGAAQPPLARNGGSPPQALCLSRKEDQGVRGFTEAVRYSQSFGGIPSTGCPWRAEMDQVSTQLRKQKKALLIAVSISVDKIVAHFSAARNLVQKAQLGDSRLTPEVGYLVLSTLCPALNALVADGLKPFQKDVITGQRPSSPWSVVEASAQPGPHTRSLNALYWRVSRLAPLRSNHQRFHAFILGLLNLKQAEEWFFHLQRNSELVSALYLPTAFLVLSQRFCRRWAEELFLLLQPLSVLPFQLDLLFEHHHLPLSVRPMPQQSTSAPEALAGLWKDSGLTQPDLEEDGSLAWPGRPHQSQLEVPLHQRLLQQRDQLAHTLLGKEGTAKQGSCPQAGQAKSLSWWKQLDWIPGLYASSRSALREGSFPSLPRALGEAIQEVRGTVAKSEGPPEVPSLKCPDGSEMQAKAQVRQGEDEPGRVWKPEAALLRADEIPEQEQNPDTGVLLGSEKGNWFGWLFGANYPVAPSEMESNLPRSRRPSRWLAPSISALDLVRKVVTVTKSPPEGTCRENSADSSQASRAAQALCDHVAGENGQLSFYKGDILQVLETVDEDWIICCSGDRRGLVPVGYTSLIL